MISSFHRGHSKRTTAPCNSRGIRRTSSSRGRTHTCWIRSLEFLQTRRRANFMPVSRTVMFLSVLPIVSVLAIALIFLLRFCFRLLLFPVIVVFPFALCAMLFAVSFDPAVCLPIVTVARLVVAADSFVPVVTIGETRKISNSSKRIRIAERGCDRSCTGVRVCGRRCATCFNNSSKND